MKINDKYIIINLLHTPVNYELFNYIKNELAKSRKINFQLHPDNIEIEWDIIDKIDVVWSKMLQWFIPVYIKTLSFLIPDILYTIKSHIQNEIKNALDFGAHQRDHILHSIRVCMLGNYILNKVNISDQNLLEYILNIYKDNYISDRTRELGIDVNYINKDFIKDVWTLSALTHDFGYIYHNLSVLSARAERFYNFVDTSNFISNLKEIENLLKNSVLKYLFEEFREYTKYPPYQDLTRLSIFANITRNHSFASAIWLLEQKEKLQKIFPERNRIVDLLFEIAAETVLWHDITSKESVFIQENRVRLPSSLSHLNFHDKPMPALLILCDNLQEWGRPKINSIYKGNLRNKKRSFWEEIEKGIIIEIQDNIITVKSFEFKKKIIDNFQKLHSNPFFQIRFLPIEVNIK